MLSAPRQETRTSIFLDSADTAEIARLLEHPLVAGFTTNPTLLRRARVRDYAAFARQLVRDACDRPVSLEVLSGEVCEIEREAHALAEFGENVFVKIPAVDAYGSRCTPTIARIARAGVRVNVTALFTPEQVARVLDAAAEAPAALLSIFAGRIADTGRDPIPLVTAAVRLCEDCHHVNVLWASTREVLNVVQATEAGCGAITLTPPLIDTLRLLGRDLDDYALETAASFYTDAAAAGLAVLAAQDVVDAI